jgi:hypothetical protein
VIDHRPDENSGFKPPTMASLCKGTHPLMVGGGRQFKALQAAQGSHWQRPPQGLLGCAPQMGGMPIRQPASVAGHWATALGKICRLIWRRGLFGCPGGGDGLAGWGWAADRLGSWLGGWLAGPTAGALVCNQSKLGRWSRGRLGQLEGLV